MCLWCPAETADQVLARRSRVLHLLALVEHPDALPASTAFRLAQEILRLTQSNDTICRCEEIASPTDSAADAERPP